ncbi:uncharacterized protein LOC129585935 [Paramacrobiotus metropolitanus]|uniref:uncharacterized protein LOC129585935 n=1 Tax=Paramacrobiotus metropolitanus TaxID=2943436 RepID=UPI002445B32B|nr:uncharacterized protein LOC129585935 [Paramacrobiotus metropolitanus]
MARARSTRAQPRPDAPIKCVRVPAVQNAAKPRAVLHDWYLKKHTAASVVQLVGSFDGQNISIHSFTEQKFTTSVIITRVSETLVTTITGSAYELRGKINAEAMRANGFSVQVIRAFENGFPSNWEDVIRQDFAKTRSAKKFDFGQKIDLLGSAAKKHAPKRELESSFQPVATASGRPVTKQITTKNPAVRNTPFSERLRPRPQIPVVSNKGVMTKVVVQKVPAQKAVERKPTGKLAAKFRNGFEKDRTVIGTTNCSHKNADIGQLTTGCIWL